MNKEPHTHHTVASYRFNGISELSIGKGTFCSSYTKDTYTGWSNGCGLGINSLDFDQVKKDLQKYAVVRLVRRQTELKAALRDVEDELIASLNNPETFMDSHLVPEITKPHPKPLR